MTPQTYLSTYYPTEASPALKSTQHDAKVRYVKCFARQRVRKDGKGGKVGVARQRVAEDGKDEKVGVRGLGVGVGGQTDSQQDRQNKRI